MKEPKFWERFRRRTFPPSAQAVEDRLDGLHSGVLDLAARINSLDAKLTRQLALNVRGEVAQDDLVLALSHLTPLAVNGHRKARFGSTHDGGYVMLDDLGGIRGAISLGIEKNDDWDLQIANLGIKVLQFDDSIDQAPSAHHNLKFSKLRVTAQQAPGCVSLDEIVEELARIGATDDLLLKMDIDDSEWDVFDSVSSPLLSKFKQIVCEFHGLDRLAERRFFTKASRVFAQLTEAHQSIHVHANNYGRIANVENIALPEVLEVTLVRRQDYAFSAGTEMFPTTLDTPNKPSEPDIFLGPFEFRTAALEVSRGSSSSSLPQTKRHLTRSA